MISAGPWEIVQTNGALVPFIRGKAGYIAALYGQPRDGEADANARLIAAAPDLLEACRVALAELLRYPASSRGIPELTAAIDKATRAARSAS